MNTVVCFTGKANVLGNPILRKELEDKVMSLGWGLTEKPEQHMGGGSNDCILVSTRDDTKKAKHAKSMGWTIMNPDEFAGHLHMNGIDELTTAKGGVINLMHMHRAEEEADRRAAEKRRDEKRAEIKRMEEAHKREMEEMQEIAGFGEWS